MKWERLSPQFETQRPLKKITSLHENRRFGLVLPISLPATTGRKMYTGGWKTINHQQPTQLEPKRLDIIPSTRAEEFVRETPQLCVPEATADSIGLAPMAPNQNPLDRRALELSENLKLLQYTLRVPKVIYKRSKKSWTIYRKLTRGVWKYVHYVMHLATIEQSATKALVTMWTFVS